MINYIKNNKSKVMKFIVLIVGIVILLVPHKGEVLQVEEVNLSTKIELSAKKELTESEKVEALLNENFDEISFFSKVFQINEETLIDKLTINYKELNLLDDGIIFKKILVDYLFNLEQSERELFGKNKVYCTKDSGYIINLINYYTDIYDNVDYSIASAIGEIESGFTSRYMLNNNNIFGGMANGRLISYKSIEYGTLMYIKMLSDGYFGKGFNTVELIGIIYNPMFNENGVKVAKPTWVNNVKRAMEKYSVKEKLDVTVFN
ncbi:putative uncharacterized protein [Clostridium sp. CAG:609]|nr:putative uncharacterized protein [Clostridium sp. CAG:609]